jgi:uncharacterized protein YjiK
MNGSNENTKTPTVFSFPYDLSQPDEIYELPDILQEISALAIAPNGELACVQDEDGIIFFYNLEKKEITNRIIFAKAGDYEGIEFVGDIAYVLRSDGTIFEIENLGKADQKVTTYDTYLSEKNDTEGLGYDSGTNSLLIACKGKGTTTQMVYEDTKVVFSFNLKNKKLADNPVIEFKKEALYDFIESNNLKKLSFKLNKKMPFNPSGIAVQNGFYFTIASVGKMLIVMDKANEIQWIEKLDKDIMPKPEGIVFDKNGNLFIASEGKKNGRGRILMFSQKSY